MQIILTPFSWLLTVFYHIFDSYAFALVLFAIVVKLILFPFSLKGKKSMIQMNLIQGEVQKLQKQYANNRMKLQEETQKLYAKEGVKPMGGCLWSFIPLLILWPLYAIIRRPFFYMMGQTGESILAIAQKLGFEGAAEMTASTVSAGYNELKIAGLMKLSDLNGVRDAANSVVSGLGDKIFHINFNFLGLDLSQVAQWKIWQNPLDWAHIGLFLLPVISAALGLAMTFVSQKTNNMNNQNNPQNSQMRTMMLISPLLSLWIGFVMPAGLCLYWIINNVLQIVQEVISGKMLKKDYEKAAAARAERERLEKEEEKRKRQEAAERRAKAIEEAKQNKGKKKKPAEKPEKKKQNTTDAGRIGMRPYARGRAYEEDRYGGVTPYQDPGAPIDENAIELARQARAEAEAEAAEKAKLEAVEAKLETGEELTEEEKLMLAAAEGVEIETDEAADGEDENEEASEAEETAQPAVEEPAEAEESAEAGETGAEEPEANDEEEEI